MSNLLPIVNYTKLIINYQLKPMPVTKIAYDELPYTCNAMPYAQPERLATVATLFGLTPPPVPSCRVLELGCGDGSNLIATAYTLPQTECVGIDVSAARIIRGQATISGVGLSNVQLKSMNILEVDDSLGQFDYIIAHGIYSWVSSAVQDKILSICHQQLVPNGVAYVSYNVKPGWELRSTLRDLMLYHTATIRDPTQREVQSSALLAILADGATENNDAYSQYLAEEIKNFNGLPKHFVFHEFLEEENKPVYFHQFLARAKVHGLTYLGDAFVHTMLTHHLSPVVAEKLQVFKNNLVHQEQVMDVLTNRHFRHTLLCHQGIPLTRSLSADDISKFYLANSLLPGANTPAGLTFTNNRGSLTTDNPMIQATLHYLVSQWPKAVSLLELIDQITPVIKRTLTKRDEFTLVNALLMGYTRGLIELYSYPRRLVTVVSEYPQASKLARWEAAQGNRVTNLRCELVVIEDVTSLQILPYLDGTRNRKDLLELFMNWIKTGRLALQVEPAQTGETVNWPDDKLYQVLEPLLDEALQVLAKGGLLEI